MVLILNQDWKLPHQQDLCRYLKIDAKDVALFQNGLVHEFYPLNPLKALITLEHVNTLVVEKKENLYERNFNLEANCRSGVVNFHCMQI